MEFAQEPPAYEYIKWSLWYIPDSSWILLYLRVEKKGGRRALKRFSEQNAERNKDSIWLNGRTAERTDFQEWPLLFFLSCCRSVKEQEINCACFMPGGSSISLSDDGSLIPHRDINITDQSTA